jgi:hypothetical protein
MPQTLIQKHSSAIVRLLAERVKALADLDHRPTKGELREIFVSNVLNLFLTGHFKIGSGIIINKMVNKAARLILLFMTTEYFRHS